MQIYGIDIHLIISLFGAFLRIFFLLLFMPFFASKLIPFSIRWLLSICLLLASFSVLEQSIGQIIFKSTEEIIFFFIKESAVGLILGFSAKFIFEAILFACHFIGEQIGMSVSSYYDDNGQNISPVSQFIFILAILLFISADIHHFVIHSIIDSFSLIPVGGVVFSAKLFEELLLLGSKFFWIVLQFSAPIAIFVFLVNISFAILSKLVPQINSLIANLALNIPLVLVFFLITMFSFEKNIEYVSGEIFHEFFKIARILSG